MVGQAEKVVPIEETKLFCQPFPVRSVPGQKLQDPTVDPLRGSTGRAPAGKPWEIEVDMVGRKPSYRSGGTFIPTIAD